MDIAALSMTMAQMNVSEKIGTAVLGQTLDNSKEMGEGLVRMLDASAMEQSVNPTVGSNVDIRV